MTKQKTFYKLSMEEIEARFKKFDIELQNEKNKTLNELKSSCIARGLSIENEE